MDSRVAILGANGAGKSTLLHLITGALQPSEGTVSKHAALKLAKYSQHSADQLPYDKSPIEYFQSLFAQKYPEKDIMVRVARSHICRCLKFFYRRGVLSLVDLDCLEHIRHLRSSNSQTVYGIGRPGCSTCKPIFLTCYQCRVCAACYGTSTCPFARCVSSAMMTRHDLIRVQMSPPITWTWNPSMPWHSLLKSSRVVLLSSLTISVRSIHHPATCYRLVSFFLSRPYLSSGRGSVGSERQNDQELDETGYFDCGLQAEAGQAELAFPTCHSCQDC